MNRLHVLACLAVTLGFFSGTSRAIPTNFGGGGFVNLANMNFEDFAALPDTWKPGAKLKATWELWKSSAVTDSAIELQRLTVSATVYGLPASEVTVQRADERVIRFDVVFQPPKGATLAQLERTLRRNLETWADRTEGDRYRGGAAGIVVTPRTADGEIVVTFTPAGDKTVTAR